MVDFEWTVSQGASVISTLNSSLLPGVNYWPTPPLAPGDYTVTMTPTSFPEMSDTVAFTIDECPMQQPGDPNPLVHDVATSCIGDDDSETLLFFVEHHAPTNEFTWSVADGQVEVDNSWVGLYADSHNLTVIRHLPVGAFQLTITNLDDPSITASTTIEVGSCGIPVDPAQTSDPAYPGEPSDSSQPPDPPETSVQADSTSQADAGSATATANLPATRFANLGEDVAVIEDRGLPIRTARLMLRAMRPADAPALAAYRGDPDVARYQSWAVPFTIDDAERFIAGLADAKWPVFGDWHQVAIDLGGVMIGDLGVNRSADGREGALGYTLAPEHHGQGYATEAVAAMVDVLFAEGVQRIAANTDPRNHPSARVLERVGFRYEGRDAASVVVRGELVDDDRYVLWLEDRRQD